MKTKIVVYVDTPELSEAVQTLAFKHGFEWGHAAQNICNLDNKMLLFEGIGIFKLIESSNVHDFDASTEFGKITEWFVKNKEATRIQDLEKEVATLQKWKDEYMEVESGWDEQEVGRELDLVAGTKIRPQILPQIKALKEANNRLKRENAQLNDDLENALSEKFPEGVDWNNPDKLTPLQVGISEGWRLLTKEECDATFREDTQIWDDNGFNTGHGWWTVKGQTFRTKSPLPSYKNTLAKPSNATEGSAQGDGFPTPEITEEEKKNIGLEWFIEYLKRCKDVRFTCSQASLCMKYGHIHYGEHLILSAKDENIYIDGLDNGGKIRVAITHIIP